MKWLSLTDDQIAGAEFIRSRPVSMLADTPGLGKTAQLVHAVDISGARRGCIICPPILRENISREFERWSMIGHDVTVIRTGKDELPSDGFVAVSYALASQPGMQQRLRKRGGDILACDEAHALKEPGARRTKAVLSAKGIARNFSKMLWMTGTPAPNNAGEFYTFAKAAGVWHGNQSAFISEFCRTVATDYGPKIVGNRNADGLKELLAPIMLRRTRIEGLPPLRVAPMPVAGDARAVNAAMDDETRAAIEHAAEIDDWSFFDTPFIATIRRLAGIAKAPGVADVVACEIEGGESKIVLFAQHTAVIDEIAARLKAYAPDILDGRTRQKDRQLLIDRFQTQPSARILICQTQSASEGLTLNSSSRVIIAEPAWTPKDNEQMIARVWRRGQRLAVRASLCTLAGSIDDQIVHTLDRKTQALAEIL